MLAGTRCQVLLLLEFFECHYVSQQRWNPFPGWRGLEPNPIPTGPPPIMITSESILEYTDQLWIIYLRVEHADLKERVSRFFSSPAKKCLLKGEIFDN